MKNKRFVIVTIALILILFLILILVVKKDNNLTQIGSSNYYIEIPQGYKLTEDDFDEDQIGYYYKDDNSIDFDVYQWSKEGIYTLKEEANYFASLYNTTATDIEINDISGMKYISKEAYDGYEYTVINYMFEDEENIIELSFWTINNQKELNDVENIINSLTKKQ